ncbi:hypothetical protein CRM22_010275 [Opisthorchis felineus]|uniref:Secreted protein n=1 Tax=Opisthorchis felineus TaxID=147828 RepID=A0A4S2L098_OPIFE|nr:hypothetical protein CRM22_010275 [Opisthorchis felineus]
MGMMMMMMMMMVRLGMWDFSVYNSPMSSPGGMCIPPNAIDSFGRQTWRRFVSCDYPSDKELLSVNYKRAGK